MKKIWIMGLAALSLGGCGGTSGGNSSGAAVGLALTKLTPLADQASGAGHDVSSYSGVVFDGALHVAYESSEPGVSASVARVRRWDGATGQWSDLGGVVHDNTADGPSLEPWLAVFKGVLYCALEQEGAVNPPVSRVTLMKWDGLAWTTVADNLNADASLDANHPTLYATTTHLYVSWEEETVGNGPRAVYVRRTADGTTWENLGSPDGQDAIESKRPKMTMLGTVPVIAWYDQVTPGLDNPIHVRQWDGTSWVTLGGKDPLNLRPGDIGFLPWVAASADTLWVAFQEERTAGSGVYQPVVLEWDGLAWTELTSDAVLGDLASTAGRNAKAPALAVVSGVPVVTWQEPSMGPGDTAAVRLRYLEKDGSAWSALLGVDLVLDASLLDVDFGPFLVDDGGAPSVVYLDDTVARVVRGE